MMPLPGPLQEAWETAWHPVRTSALAGISIAFLLLGWAALAAESGWIPLLDGVNLLFHEAGHPIFGLLGWEPLTALGGTLMQLLVPLLVLGSFWLRRDAPGTALAGLWLGENGLNIARYVADARAQALPLVGGGDHDWATLLGRWGLLRQDTTIAQVIRTLGWLGMIASLAWLIWRWQRGRAQA